MALRTERPVDSQNLDFKCFAETCSRGYRLLRKADSLSTYQFIFSLTYTNESFIIVGNDFRGELDIPQRRNVEHLAQ